MSSDNVAAEELTMYIERVERLESDRTQISEQIREIYKDAQGRGYDSKVMKQIIRLRKLDEEDREAQEMLLDVYKRALGMMYEGDNEDSSN